MHRQARDTSYSSRIHIPAEKIPDRQHSSKNCNKKADAMSIIS